LGPQKQSLERRKYGSRTNFCETGVSFELAWPRRGPNPSRASVERKRMCL